MFVCVYVCVYDHICIIYTHLFLGIASTYEKKHVTFVLLDLDYFAYYDDLQSTYPQMT
jgi:hypothetical protein